MHISYTGTNLSRLFEKSTFATSPLRIFQERHRERLIDLPADNWLLGSHCAHTYNFVHDLSSLVISGNVISSYRRL